MFTARSTVLLVLTAGAALAPTQIILAADEPSRNAALQYWLAFALIPQEGRESKLLNSATSDDPAVGFGVRLTPELARLCQREQPAEALARLHRGSRLTDCNWGTDFAREGPTSASYADKAHKLARLALLRARWRFEQGKWDDGVDDVIATMILARHLGRDKASPALHFGVMIESMSVKTAAVYLPAMPDAARTRFSAKLAALPAVTSMTDVFRKYEEAVDWFVEDFRQAGKRGRLLARLESAMSSPEHAKGVLSEVGDAEGLVRFAPEARALLREGGKAMELGVDEFRQVFATRFAPKVGKNPLIRAMGIPAFNEEYDEQAVGRCRLALLKAGIDVLTRGQPALADHSDPYGKGPFGYTAFAGGFELRSRLAVPAGAKERLVLSLDFGLRSK
jgi:hypothetical protein